MDQTKTGELIRTLRTGMGLTQKQLAERLNVSDKAVSKWECGNGCPDVSLLSGLASVFGTDIQMLLDGEIEKNERGKDMKKMRFYVCPDCGNIITAASEAAVTCCGNKLTALEMKEADDSEKLKVEDIGGEWYITSDHPMTKQDYISFVAYVCESSMMMFRQYPEWNVEIYLTIYRAGRLVWYATDCGLLYQDITP